MGGGALRPPAAACPLRSPATHPLRDRPLLVYSFARWSAPPGALPSYKEVVIEPVGRSGLVETFERVAADLGRDAALREVEVIKTSAHRRRGQVELRLVIDKAGGVDVATCERISHKINTALDGYADPYTLSVESVGLERPLTRPSDYERFIGSNVKLRTDIAIHGAKTHRGRLVGVRGTNVVLTQTQGELPVPLVLIKHANVEYDVRADLKKEKQERRHRHNEY